MATHDNASGDIFQLAPDIPSAVSTPSACDTDLTADKRAAVGSYLNTLGPALQDQHGAQPHYTPNQVHDAVLGQALSIDYICWAYMLFCSPADFSTLHAGTAELCDAGVMREAVAETFFNGNTGFDALELAGSITSGAAEALSTGAAESTTWLADVDWSAIFGLC